MKKLSDITVLVVSFLLIIWTIQWLPYDLTEIAGFLWRQIGPTSPLLIPMAVFVLATVFTIPFERPVEGSLVVEALEVIHFLAPLLGFIGTLLGFVSGVLALKQGFNTNAVLEMAIRTGQGITSTLLAISIMAVTGLLLRYGVKPSISEQNGSRILGNLKNLSEILEESRDK